MSFLDGISSAIVPDRPETPYDESKSHAYVAGIFLGIIGVILLVRKGLGSAAV